ncbi:MAG: helix-turn-helix transcriptional regulator [Gluconacetobacter diazotrophicus]|nr:helix-turn-helix transcriptional regulator [Gluconacetobacter diazotrophicus]
MPRPDLTPGELTAITRALADPRRYDIVTQLAAADADVSCCSLREAGRVSASTMTHHLQTLEQAGLVTITRDGRAAVLRFERARWEDYLRRLAADAAPQPPP